MLNIYSGHSLKRCTFPMSLCYTMYQARLCTSFSIQKAINHIQIEIFSPKDETIVWHRNLWHNQHKAIYMRAGTALKAPRSVLYFVGQLSSRISAPPFTILLVSSMELSKHWQAFSYP